MSDLTAKCCHVIESIIYSNRFQINGIIGQPDHGIRDLIGSAEIIDTKNRIFQRKRTIYIRCMGSAGYTDITINSTINIAHKTGKQWGRPMERCIIEVYITIQTLITGAVKAD